MYHFHKKCVESRVISILDLKIYYEYEGIYYES